MLVETLKRLIPTANAICDPVDPGPVTAYAPPLGGVGTAAETVDIAPTAYDVVVDMPGFVTTFPHTSQSPGVSVMEVILAVVAFNNETEPPTATEDEMYCPTLPAEASSLVLVPGNWPAVSFFWNDVSVNAVVAICVVAVPGDAVGARGTPVNVGDANGAAPGMSESARVTAPVLVLTDATPATPATTAFVTKAVVASCVVLAPGAAVGAAGTPVNVGLALGAKSASAAVARAVSVVMAVVFVAIFAVFVAILVVLAVMPSSVSASPIVGALTTGAMAADTGYVPVSWETVAERVVPLPGTPVDP